MILAGILRQPWTNERGETFIGESKIVGSWEGDSFYCADFENDRYEGEMRLSKEDFDKYVSDVREVF